VISPQRLPKECHERDARVRLRDVLFFRVARSGGTSKPPRLKASGVLPVRRLPPNVSPPSTTARSAAFAIQRVFGNEQYKDGSLRVTV
jgi:hypothetical protein